MNEITDEAAKNLLLKEVKAQMQDELDPVMMGWTYDQMVAELRSQIRHQGKAVKQRPLRYFSRHFLELRGDGFKLVSAWLRGKEIMDREDIQRVLTVLKKLRNQNPDPKALTARDQIEEPSSGPRRKLVDHTIAVFSSLADLVAASNTRREDAFDGDRIELVKSLKTVCKHFGIRVVFPNIDDKSRPVTEEDLNKLYGKKK